MPVIRNQSHLDELTRTFVKRHPIFNSIVKIIGSPPFWNRPATYETLVHIILEQQVSLASAKATLEKLRMGVKVISPNNFLSCSPEELLGYGLSRQKARYCRGLAEAVLEEKIFLKKLSQLSIEESRAALLELVGIGPWTTEVWHLMVENRADAFPAGDIALQQSWKEFTGLKLRPNSSELEKIAEDWRPLRSIGARLLWHRYLHQRNKI